MDLNVKVAIRCRPMSAKEIATECTSIVTMTPTTVHVANLEEHNASKDFTFDHCYFTDSTQEQVYEDLGFPLLDKAIDGFNGTIFAYGQTGTGKSFSMTGSESAKGLIPRINENLWKMTSEKLTQMQAKDNEGTTKFMITVSFLEIYNEIIKDLLNPSDKPLKIRENPKQGIYVEGLCELIVKDAVELMRLIDQGNTVRRVAATNMNDQSSRSHSCFTIKIEKKTTTELDSGATREQFVRAKLNLVDLAGSERADKTGATGATLREGANINMSLMALGNVINALSEGMTKDGKKFIPYRDSKLTRLLQESLGGNSLTVMLAAISPADYNFDETISTLKYANRAKSIANAVTRNENSNERMIRDLKQQIELLKQQIQTSGGTGTNPETERKLQEMEMNQRNAWEEKEKLSRALELERQANLNTVVSSMMKNVKEQKVSHMKNIRRLTNEKTVFGKKCKEMKDTSVAFKLTLDEDVKQYQLLQQQYDQLMTAPDAIEDPEIVVNIASQMTDILARIETNRKKWLDSKELLKKCKTKLADIEEKMTDERAELVATAGLLDQNDKLRSQIQSEEREKAKEMIDAEIAMAREKLNKESENIRSVLEGEMAGTISSMQESLLRYQEQLHVEELKTAELTATISSMRLDMEYLEGDLADAEVSLETAQAEVKRLQQFEDLPEVVAQLQAEISQLKKQADKQQQQQQETLERTVKQREQDQQLAIKNAVEEAKYQLFQVMMQGFDRERSVMTKKLADSQALFTNAVQDIMHLARENHTLKATLSQAVLWEPEIRARSNNGTMGSNAADNNTHNNNNSGNGTSHGNINPFKGGIFSNGNSNSNSNRTSPSAVGFPTINSSAANNNTSVINANISPRSENKRIAINTFNSGPPTNNSSDQANNNNSSKSNSNNGNSTILSMLRSNAAATTSGKLSTIIESPDKPLTQKEYSNNSNTNNNNSISNGESSKLDHGVAGINGTKNNMVSRNNSNTNSNNSPVNGYTGSGGGGGSVAYNSGKNNGSNNTSTPNGSTKNGANSLKSNLANLSGKSSSNNNNNNNNNNNKTDNTTFETVKLSNMFSKRAIDKPPVGKSPYN